MPKIFVYLLPFADTITRGSQISTHSRCRHNYLSYGGYTRILSRSATQSTRNFARCRAVSIIRTNETMGSYVFSSSVTGLSLFDTFPCLPSLVGRQRHSDNLSAKEILLCSSVAKMTASIATYPHEVVRTRLQTLRIHRDVHLNGQGNSHPPTGIIWTVRNMVAREGWRSLYRGLSVNLVRTVPNSAVTMLT